MVTLNNQKNTINMTISDKVEKREILTKKYLYSVQLPEITCDNKEMALHIQSEINDFANKLVRSLIKENED